MNDITDWEGPGKNRSTSGTGKRENDFCIKVGGDESHFNVS